MRDDEDVKLRSERLEFAAELRRTQTDSEKLLWRALSARKTGFKFSRQIVIGRYVVDFCCRQHRVVVEVDGDSHENRIEEDNARDRYLNEQGYVILRFRNGQVAQDYDAVVSAVKQACEEQPRFRY